MLVYIVRHGDAELQSKTGCDQDRILTELGHQQARAIGVYLAGCRPMPTQIITSPFVRAQQTAQTITDALSIGIETDDRLGADRGLTEMLAVLEDQHHQEAIAIISHMPTVGRLRTLLTEGPTAQASSLHTGEVAVIRIDHEELVAGGTLLEIYRLKQCPMEE